MNNAIHELLRSDGTIYVNRALAKAIGLNEAILYGALLSKEGYYESCSRLDGNGMFYATAEDIEKTTALTARQQKLAIDNLISHKLIESKLKGVPAKKWFKINKDTSIVEALIQKGKEEDSRFAKKSYEEFPLIISEDESETEADETSNQVSTKGRNKDKPNVEASIDETSEQDCTKGRNNIIRNKDNKKDTREKEESKKESADAGDVNNTDGKVKTKLSQPKRPVNNFEKMINGFTENENVRKTLWEYLRMRQVKKVATTDHAFELVLRHLSEITTNADEQILVLDKSIVNGWTDVFALKEPKGGVVNGQNSKSNGGGAGNTAENSTGGAIAANTGEIRKSRYGETL